MSGLTGDTTITSPTTGQALRFNSVTGKWENGTGLTDTVITSTTDAGVVANFSTAQLLSPTAGALLDWTAGLKFLAPLQDSSAAQSIDPTGRKLYKSDGTTSMLEWGTAVKFPQLTNSNANAFMTTDASGNVSLAAVPNAGTIEVTTNLLQGDGAGNAVVAFGSPALIAGGLTLTGFIDGDYLVSLWNQNTGASGAVGTQFLTYDGYAQIKLIGSGNTGTGIIGTDDLWIRNDIAGGDIVITTNNGLIRFSANSGTNERVTIGNGLAVGTTTDPGAGVVNVSSGYRIGNAAGYNKSLVGNNTSFISGDVPGKASVTSTVVQTATTETSHFLWNVPANSASVGTTYRIAAWGNMDHGTTAVTFTPRIRWNGAAGVQLIATPTAVGDTTSRTNQSWKIEAYVTIRTTGATGTAVCVNALEHHVNTTYASDEADSGATAVTIDTTSGNNLALTWALSTATGTPHVRTFGGTIEVVKP